MDCNNNWKAFIKLCKCKMMSRVINGMIDLLIVNFILLNYFYEIYFKELDLMNRWIEMNEKKIEK